MRMFRIEINADTLVQMDEKAEQTGVQELLVEGGRITGVKTATGTISADSVTITAGAWSEQLLSPLGVAMPTRPIKGQMLVLDPGRVLLGRIIEHEKCYLVPRDEGFILAGATEEHVGFDDTLTGSAIDYLRNEAIAMVPALAEAKVVNHWCGFRPGSIRGLGWIVPFPTMA
jgi:glycine oxidase